MINKPVNVFPFNTCVNKNSEWSVSCEIPNDTIDQAYVSIRNLESSEDIYGEYIEFETPTNKIKKNITNDIPSGEYSWSTFYLKTPSENNSKVEYEVVDNNEDVVTLSSVNYTVEYNTQPVVSSYVTTFDKSEANKYLGISNKEYSEYKYLEGLPILISSGSGGSGLNGIVNFFTGKNIEDYYIRVELKDGSLIAIFKVMYIRGYNIVVNSFDDVIIEEKIGTSSFGSTNPESIYATSSWVWKICKNTKTDSNISTINSYISSTNSNQLYKVDTISEDYYLKITTIPKLSSYNLGGVGNKIFVYPKNTVESNSSPDYYFRVKSTPEITEIETYNQFTQNIISSEDDIETYEYTLFDIEAYFGVKYKSNVKFNYGYFYISAYNENTFGWEIIERSEMILSSNSADIDNQYKYSGFIDGKKYKIYATYVDIDGDEWTTEEFEFAVNLNLINKTDVFSTYFNKNKTTIDISTDWFINKYKNFSVEFYKCKITDNKTSHKLVYAGGGLCKTGGEHVGDYYIDGQIIAFNKFVDYNLENNSYYNYYAKVNYQGLNFGLNGEEDIIGNEDVQNTNDGIKKTDFYLIGSNIYTNFEGTSVLSLQKVDDTQLEIVQNFNLFYKFEESSSELTNEINREYINTFSKYPVELKGSQNNISSRCSGLLGNEVDGLYVEPKGIREDWINFINDNTIKFYRGSDGVTAIISIQSNSIKAQYFSNYGLVNEVNMSFKEIGSTNQYAIFTTERFGD